MLWETIEGANYDWIEVAMSCVVLAYLNLSIIADCSTNRLARPDTEVVPFRSTENQPKMTEFLLSYFVGEYKIGKPMMQKQWATILWVTMHHCCIVSICSEYGDYNSWFLLMLYIRHSRVTSAGLYKYVYIVKGAMILALQYFGNCGYIFLHKTVL